MATNGDSDTSQTKRRSTLVPLALVLLAGAAFAVAFVALGGVQLVDTLLRGEPQVAVTPQQPVAQPPAEPVTPPAQPAPSEVETPPALAPAPEEPGEPRRAQPPAPAPDPGVLAPGAQVSVPDSARVRMYWEQVDSQEQIRKLVEGDIASFSLSPVSVTQTEARFRVQTAGDTPVSGTAVLRAYDGIWFFSSITADGNVTRGAAGRRGDVSVTNTIVEQQAASQDVITSFVDGGYRSVRVTGVTMGSGTATIHVELGGGTKPRSAGQIVCISKNIGGQKHWFLTSFREI